MGKASNSKSPLQQIDWTNASTDEHEESFYVVWEDYIDKPNLQETMAESTNSHHLDEMSNLMMVANSVVGEEGAAASASAHGMRARLVPNVQHLTSAKLNRTLKTKLLFVLGREENGGFPVSAALMNEQKAHGDLVVENFIDTYFNLTLKSLFLIKYVKMNCPNVKYVAKVDDDVFLHVPNLHRTLTTKDTTEKLIMGFIICNSQITVDPRSKWYSPHYMYAGDHYPNYLSGTAYILSSSVLTPLLEAAMLTPLFHLEDVYITGILAQKIGVTPQDSVDFSYKTNPRDPCLYQNLSVGHDMEPLQMYELWNTLHLTNMTTSCGPVTAAHIGYTSPRECSASPESHTLLSRLSSYFY
ncbi:hypothetical protein HAZT_HAZT006448 [Hyalella azteca]|nr:hypothetical protein HAZT_HAZT006448 [Hyalella azteca]